MQTVSALAWRPLPALFFRLDSDRADLGIGSVDHDDRFGFEPRREELEKRDRAVLKRAFVAGKGRVALGPELQTKHAVPCAVRRFRQRDHVQEVAGVPVSELDPAEVFIREGAAHGPFAGALGCRRAALLFQNDLHEDWCGVVV